MTNQKGQSLFEVIVAMAIVTMILTAVVALAATSIRNTTSSRNEATATRLAQEAIEWLRGERDASWQIFANNSLTPTWCFETLSWSKAGPCTAGDEVAGTIFRRGANFANAGTSVEASVVVSWADAQGDHEVRTSTLFTDWRTQ
ncbi:MAG: hypothetical protein UW21_C0007G0014 [Candidatus Woesebacteria bacterium GW2011_GWB1_44_11b]|uniref:Type II secretion system protein n=1 Tax=Candidatus Woesebacteria bacterium GW2011_GWB1_44_11b TaxID=1618580 RepID=A0A0G1IPZ4_9BACT|nr:MAG: hypothetical protein UW21_C0007G0014 [Candidatus Woesebacteria bacterium GW2011_GWB1_44_11b]